MSAHDRDIAGIRCKEVLAHLSEYVDGDIDPRTKKKIDGHLAGCDWCEKFGGEFSKVIGEFRRNLSRAAPIDQSLAERLRAKINQAGRN